MFEQNAFLIRHADEKGVERFLVRLLQRAQRNLRTVP